MSFWQSKVNAVVEAGGATRRLFMSARLRAQSRQQQQASSKYNSEEAEGKDGRPAGGGKGVISMYTDEMIRQRSALRKNTLVTNELDVWWRCAQHSDRQRQRKGGDGQMGSGESNGTGAHDPAAKSDDHGHLNS